MTAKEWTDKLLAFGVEFIQFLSANNVSQRPSLRFSDGTIIPGYMPGVELQWEKEGGSDTRYGVALEVLYVSSDTGIDEAARRVREFLGLGGGPIPLRWAWFKFGPPKPPPNAGPSPGGDPPASPVGPAIPNKPGWHSYAHGAETMPETGFRIAEGGKTYVFHRLGIFGGQWQCIG